MHHNIVTSFRLRLCESLAPASLQV
jgi:hypothetical protein